MLNLNLVQTITTMGRRLADAGREARAASRSVAGPAADQVTEVIGAAVGEVVRAAVIGAVVAVVRGAATAVPRTVALPQYDSWDDEDFSPAEDTPNNAPTGRPADGVPPDAASPTRPAWVRATRAVGSALGVAAGAAAAVPGGKFVAAGLGGLAAVAGLAARAATPATE